MFSKKIFIVIIRPLDESFGGNMKAFLASLVPRLSANAFTLPPTPIGDLIITINGK